MRIFKNKAFHRWIKEVGLSDSQLKNAVIEICNGLYEANLGGNIFKKRIALAARGKSSGVRTVVGFKLGKIVFFVYGFAKNDRSNISEQEEKVLKNLVKFFFSLDEKELTKAVDIGELIEVK